MKKVIFTVLIFVLMIGSIFIVWNIKNNDILNDIILPNETQNNDFSFEVTKKIEIEKLKTYKLPILIELGAEGCPPCREMAPILKKLNIKLQGKAIIKTVDVWKNPSLGEEFDFIYIPTQIFINSDGTPFKPDENLKDILDVHKEKNGIHKYTSHTGPLSEDKILEILKKAGLKNE